MGGNQQVEEYCRPSTTKTRGGLGGGRKQENETFSLSPNFNYKRPTPMKNPYSFDTDPDPAFKAEYRSVPDPIRIQGFDDRKLEKIYS